MAIKSTEKNKEGSEEKELQVNIDNGDLKLINSLIESFDFKDSASLFKFAIAALLEANNNEGIYTVKNDEDKKILSKITPSKDMLKSSND